MNGDDIEFHHGDKVVTLAEQLASMNKAIRRLEVASLFLIVLVVLSAILTDEHMNLLIDGILDLVGS